MWIKELNKKKKAETYDKLYYNELKGREIYYLIYTYEL